MTVMRSGLSCICLTSVNRRFWRYLKSNFLWLSGLGIVVQSFEGADDDGNDSIYVSDEDGLF